MMRLAVIGRKYGLVRASIFIRRAQKAQYHVLGVFPGKDYSNPRLSDFYNLNKHEEDMYDRTKVPRMPW
jgi:hypothetical protein